MLVGVGGAVERRRWCAAETRTRISYQSGTGTWFGHEASQSASLHGGWSWQRSLMPRDSP